VAFPVGTRTTGEFITPAIWNADLVANINFIRPLTARLTSDFSVTSNTSLQNVTGLSFAIAASEVWAVQLRASVLVPGTPDGKFHWSFPAGATGHHTLSSSQSANRDVVANDLVVAGTGGTDVFHFEATIINSTTPGTVQFQMAQFTSDASSVTMHANAVLIANRLA
jgi:hypothetical protein